MARHSAVEIATGAGVLLIAGGFLVFAVANTGEKFGGGGYALNAVFDHVDGLSTGADVRIAGVKVGSVLSIRLDPKTYQADVAFDVQKDVQLSTDSSATISTDGLLGGKYLSLGAGGEDTLLKPGGTITITQGSVNLEALIGKYIFGSTGGKSGAPALGGPAQAGATQAGAAPK
jgi:phospholipid/cholesterol/gamma-HCH transport system substrate-binding protein